MMIQVMFHCDVFLRLFGGCDMNKDNAPTIKRRKNLGCTGVKLRSMGAIVGMWHVRSDVGPKTRDPKNHLNCSRLNQEPLILGYRYLCETHAEANQKTFWTFLA